jgi:hypothetical protein
MLSRILLHKYKYIGFIFSSAFEAALIGIADTLTWSVVHSIVIGSWVYADNIVYVLSDMQDSEWDYDLRGCTTSILC